jgi:hypothetical protein
MAETQMLLKSEKPLQKQSGMTSALSAKHGNGRTKLGHGHKNAHQAGLIDRLA